MNSVYHKAVDAHKVCTCKKCIKALVQHFPFRMSGLFNKPSGEYFFVDENGDFIHSGMKVDISQGMPESFEETPVNISYAQLLGSENYMKIVDELSVGKDGFGECIDPTTGLPPEMKMVQQSNGDISMSMDLYLPPMLEDGETTLTFKAES